MLAIGTRVRLMGGPAQATVIGHTFYHRTSWKTMEPGYVVELDPGTGGYIDNARTPRIFVDTLVVHVTSLEEVIE